MSDQEETGELYASYCNKCWGYFEISMSLKEAIDFYDKGKVCPLCHEGNICYCVPPWYDVETLGHQRVYTREISGVLRQITRYRWHYPQTGVLAYIYVLLDRVFVYEVLRGKTIFFTSPSVFSHEGIGYTPAWSDLGSLIINDVSLDEKKSLEDD